MTIKLIVCCCVNMEEEKTFNSSKEEWLDVIGYEGYYQVSNLGRVKVLPHKVVRGFCTAICQEQILKPRVKNNKYLFVRLSNGSKKTSREKYVHRLVAEAFISNPEHKAEVDHIDGNVSNNIVTNLRWCTRLENVNNPNTVYKNTLKVLVSSRDGIYSEVFPSLTQASKKLNIPLSTLSWAKSQQKKNANVFRYIIKEI